MEGGESLWKWIGSWFWVVFCRDAGFCLGTLCTRTSPRTWTDSQCNSVCGGQDGLAACPGQIKIYTCAQSGEKAFCSTQLSTSWEARAFLWRELWRKANIVAICAVCSTANYWGWRWARRCCICTGTKAPTSRGRWHISTGKGILLSVWVKLRKLTSSRAGKTCLGLRN